MLGKLKYLDNQIDDNMSRFQDVTKERMVVWMNNSNPWSQYFTLYSNLGM